ncbi:MAG: ORC1-type DNA replication protein [Candidatus Aenigmatarchaeota archaeon]
MVQQTLKDIFSGYSKKENRVFKNKDVLTERYIPETIPHREDNINQLAKIIAPAIRGDNVSNVFIYGSTGTGKSVCTKHVMTEIEKESDKIRVLFINCKMKKVSDTEYRLLAELSRILGKRVPSTGLPTDEVYKIFFEALEEQEKNVILVLDEIDALVKKVGDDILYTLTRINQDLVKTKLSIIGISNDTTFTDRLDPRVKSSLSEEEIIFQPYDAKQLQDILFNRAKVSFVPGVVDDAVIFKCAALAAQEHGDARRALDLFRIAGELAERENYSKVTTELVDKAEAKLDTDRIVEIIKFQPKQSQAVIASIIKLVEAGEKNIQTGDVFVLYEKICHSRGLKSLTQRRVSDLVAELDMLGVINARVISKGRYGRTREIKFLLGSSLKEKVKKILKDNYLLTDGLYLDAKKKSANTF